MVGLNLGSVATTSNLPATAHRMGADGFVRREDRRVCMDRHGHEQPVEGILVVVGQLTGSVDVLSADRAGHCRTLGLDLHEKCAILK